MTELLPPGGPSRFDLVLFVMGAALATAAAVAALSAVPAAVAALGGSLVASVALYDGVVRRPPA